MNPYLPKYFTSKAIAVYFIVLLLCSLRFYNRTLPFIWLLFGALEVICFFYFSNILTKRWRILSPYIFKKRLFRTALIIRILYVLFSYVFYYWMTGQPFEFAAADSMGYDGEAKWLLDLTFSGQFDVYAEYIKGNYSDMGYVSYLALVYALSWKSILVARIIKAVLGAYLCVMVYKLAERNFGESTAKIAGVAAMLFPNLIYYCGLHLKETEMVFLTVLFIERADFVIRQRKLNITILLITIMIGLLLFFFRTVLGVVAMASLGMGFLFISSQKYGLVKKVVFGIAALLFVIFLSGGKLEKEIVGYWGAKDSNQKISLEARAEGEDGNKFAKYGSTAIFLPIILIAPIPTLVNIQTQQNQMLIHGGNFIKNILGFFVLIALFLIYKAKKMKEYALILSFIFSYLAVIAMSKFALVERFHLPVLPFLIILGAFGITKLNSQNKKYYIPYLFFVALLIMGWNFFKLAGRGLE